jgi:hypothetical protein
MRTWRRVQSLVVILVLVPATTALGKTRVIAPPGDSAVSQYVEDVPTASGGTPSQPTGGNPRGGALTPAQGRALAAHGPDGRLLAAVVDATAPVSRGPHAGTTGSPTGGRGRGAARTARGGGSGSSHDASVASLSPLNAPKTSSAAVLVRAVAGADSGSLGVVLTALMVLTIGLALGWSLRRRRASP